MDSWWILSYCNLIMQGQFIYCSLITRAALIYLKRVEGRSTDEQDHLDQAMEDAMAEAHASAGIMLSLGKELTQRQEYTLIMRKVQEELQETINRVQFSYAILMFATLKVRKNNLCIIIILGMWDPQWNASRSGDVASPKVTTCHVVR